MYYGCGQRFQELITFLNLLLLIGMYWLQIGCMLPIGNYLHRSLILDTIARQNHRTILLSFRVHSCARNISMGDKC